MFCIVDSPVNSAFHDVPLEYTQLSRQLLNPYTGIDCSAGRVEHFIAVSLGVKETDILEAFLTTRAFQRYDMFLLEEAKLFCILHYYVDHCRNL